MKRKASIILAGLLLCAGRGEADPATWPGVIDLEGSWQVVTGQGASADVASRADLPATWAELGLAGYDGPVRFGRELILRSNWREKLAPSGLAVLIDAGKHGAYELFAGGESVGGYGDDRLRIPSPAVKVFAVPAERVESDGRLRLSLLFHRVAWASDRATAGGPVGNRVLAGDLDTLRSLARLENERSRHGAFHAVLISALLAAVGFYHLQLFRRRRRCAEYLWFGMVSLDFAAIICAGYLSDRLTDSFALAQRLSGVTIHLAVALLVQLLWPYLSRPISRWLRRYQFSHLAIAAAVMVAPAEWVVRSGSWRWAWILPLLIGLWRLLAGGTRRGDPDARTIGLGALAVAGAGLGEAVFQILDRGTLHPLPAWALALFALSMAVSLSDRYSRLHLDLDQLRQDLELRVEDATAELSAANRLLAAENTDRRLAQESMRMLERAVEQSIDGMAVADMAGATEFINEAWARMHGYEVPEVLGYDLNLFHNREQMQESVYPLLSQVREQGSFDGEVWHRHRDGSTFPTWMTVNLLRDPDGEPLGIVAIARDITRRRKDQEEQQRLEAQLQQAAKLESLADLAEGIAHDYNNLLTGVLVHANLAMEEVDPGSPVGEKIRRIEQTAERAADLSDQLLAFAGADQPDARTLYLNELIRELKPELGGRISDRTALQFQLRPGLAPIDVDPGQIRRVLLRLVSNAADAVAMAPPGEERDGGVITVRTSRVEAERSYFLDAWPREDHAPGPYVFFEVSDSGIGIDDEIRARMFDPFFTTKTTGRGLGLATALGIVGAHGGAIKVYSQPGRGTTFEVLFPASSKLKVAAKPRGLETWTSAGAILVVDDEQLVLEVTKDILEAQGFEVLTARGGPQALEIFDRSSAEISMVLLDMTMPVMDGDEVLRQLRRRDPDVQVVLMSGYSRSSVTQRLAGEKFGGILHKPFRPQELIGKLSEVMERS